MTSNHILIFDIGKTNKKYLIFDQEYAIVYEYAEELPETKDEDGFPCEDIHLLTDWIYTHAIKQLTNTEYNIKAINFSGYGASFVLLDQEGRILAPLYNYLKPLDKNIRNQFFDTYGDEKKLCLETCSPNLGNLNSGLQLYRLKYEKPAWFDGIRYALHLPQYLSFIFTRAATSHLTSIGCHTMLWDFEKKDYHHWVRQEKIDTLFPANAISDSLQPCVLQDQSIQVGIGLHDSSAALIPYLKLRSDPFILLSTGTWCIALNPFSTDPLTLEELAKDCLCYLSYESKPIKASRLFLGHEHQEMVKRIAKHFQVDEDFYKTVVYNPALFIDNTDRSFQDQTGLIRSGFEKRPLNAFADEITAYHALIQDFVITQVKSLLLIQKEIIGIDILVDGGFAQNELFMSLLARSLPQSAVYAAEIHQASATGAAMVVHDGWNSLPLKQDLIKLKYYESR